MNTFKTFLLTCAIALGSISCGSKNKERSEFDLFPVPRISLNSPERLSDPSPKYKDKDGRPVSGYIDRDGQLVINLQFDYADDFSNGLARVITNKKFGYINTNGEFVIKPQFDFAENFVSEKEPLALVRVGNKYGYIDKSGNYVISLQFDDAGSFTHYFSEVPDKWGYSLAKVKVGDKWGFIEKSGNYVIAPQFSWVGSFSEGRAVVQVGDKCGYIDELGKMVIEPQFYCTLSDVVLAKGPSAFSGGLARVIVIDTPIQTKTTQTKTPTLGISGVGVEPKFKYGFIDRTGKFVIEPQFDNAKDFSGGFAAVGFAQNLTILQGHEQQGGKVTFENTPNRIVKWGFINETGRIVINPMFDSVESFTLIVRSLGNGVTGEWLAAVRTGEVGSSRCGYIDGTGKYVINPRFSEYSIYSPFSGCNSFSAGGFANIGSDYGESSVIDNTGKTIFTYHR